MSTLTMLKKEVVCNQESIGMISYLPFLFMMIVVYGGKLTPKLHLR